MRDHIKSILDEAISKISRDKFNQIDFEYNIEIPDDKFGDYSTNVAMKLASKNGLNAHKLAIEISEILKDIDKNFFELVSVVGGFINFKIKDVAYRDLLKNLSFKAFESRNEKLLIEFGSINPTGPLHVGHGVQLIVGDVLASILEYSGYTVTREYYVNDNGIQVTKLAESLNVRLEQSRGRDVKLPEDGYHGEYVKDMAKGYDGSDIESFAVNWALNNIKKSISNLRISYDLWVSEKSLHKNGALSKFLELMKEKSLVYVKDEAIWLKTTNFGDDKDRVVMKSDGLASYFASDLLYSQDKVERGYSRIITVLGADHHGYLPRYDATFKLANFNVSEVVLVQLVNVLRSGEKIKMSKRAGDFYSLNDLIDEVGVDSCRLFFLTRKSDSPIDFDIELAKKRDASNPLFYIQYAYARILSVIKKIEDDPKESLKENMFKEISLDVQEKRIIKHLSDFKVIVESSAKSLDANILYNYLYELAHLFHSFYNSCKIINDKKDVQDFRKLLSIKVKEVLDEIFKIFKIIPMEKM